MSAHNLNKQQDSKYGAHELHSVQACIEYAVFTPQDERPRWSSMVMVVTYSQTWSEYSGSWCIFLTKTSKCSILYEILDLDP